MTHHAAPEFWSSYRSLPADVRTLADRAFALLKADPYHPSLYFKKIEDFWSVRVGIYYRALVLRSRAASSGSGSARMRSTTELRNDVWGLSNLRTSHTLTPTLSSSPRPGNLWVSSDSGLLPGEVAVKLPAGGVERSLLFLGGVVN